MNMKLTIEKKLRENFDPKILYNIAIAPNIDKTPKIKQHTLKIKDKWLNL